VGRNAALACVQVKKISVSSSSLVKTVRLLRKNKLSTQEEQEKLITDLEDLQLSLEVVGSNISCAFETHMRI
jgi:predicted nucleic-acid-binding protein